MLLFDLVYDEEKTGRPYRMQKASLTWEWTAGSVNINSAELLLNWPLCVETPDGKCLFLFLSAVKTWPLFLNTVSGTSGCAFGPVRSNTVARLSFLLCWHFIRMETTREQYQVILLSGLSDRTKWKNHSILIQRWVMSSRKTQGNSLPYNQLSFPDCKTKSA